MITLDAVQDGDVSIYDLMDLIRAHPMYVASVTFTTDDFSDYGDINPKPLEDAMCQAGFEAAEELGMTPAEGAW